MEIASPSALRHISHLPLTFSPCAQECLPMPTRNDKSNDKIRQSDSPVKVPRTPNAHTQKGDEAPIRSQPAQDPSAGSSWADNTKPAPRKHKARTHLF